MKTRLSIAAFALMASVAAAQTEHRAQATPTVSFRGRGGAEASFCEKT